MEWTQNGFILGARKHGETSVILEVMTEERGRCVGLVRGGRSKRMQPVLQTGNRVRVTWRARLEDHLGVFQVDPLEMRAARLMESDVGLYTLQVLSCHLRLLSEREPHPGLTEVADYILENVSDPEILSITLLRFELALLDNLGFGLDLSQCAATGASRDLVYVSPKSGRAVSREAGLPYHDRLLALPAFLSSRTLAPTQADLAAAFQLTSFFLHRHIYEPRGLVAPIEREFLQKKLMKFHENLYS